jgi:hypothetical protein
VERIDQRQLRVVPRCQREIRVLERIDEQCLSVDADPYELLGKRLGLPSSMARSLKDELPFLDRCGRRLEGVLLFLAFIL